MVPSLKWPYTRQLSELFGKVDIKVLDEEIGQTISDPALIVAE